MGQKRGLDRFLTVLKVELREKKRGSKNDFGLNSVSAEKPTQKFNCWGFLARDTHKGFDP